MWENCYTDKTYLKGVIIMTEKFLEYLDGLKELITIFESMELSTEIMGEVELSEEQVEAVNAYLEVMQNAWEDSFLIMLENGIKWIKHNKEVE